MAGYIAEFFGYSATDKTQTALDVAAKKNCPFTGAPCAKFLGRERTVSGVCAIRQKSKSSGSVICCPYRIYADNYKMLYTVSKDAFKDELNLYSGRAAVAKAIEEGGAIAVFGKGWGRRTSSS